MIRFQHLNLVPSGEATLGVAQGPDLAAGRSGFKDGHRYWGLVTN